MPLSLFPRSRTVRVPVDNEQVAIRQVQVTKRARPLVGRFVTTVLITYCVASTLSALVSDDLKKPPKEARSQDKSQTEAVRKPTDHWKRQHEALSRLPSMTTSASTTSSHTDSNAADADDSQIVHLTLPIWFRQRQQRIQTPQDSEWQEYKDLVADNEQKLEVHKKTAFLVLQLCQQRPDLKQWLRWIQFNGRTSGNFDIAPQIFSPTVYEVPCVFVKPNQVELGWRALSPTTGARIERIFHPVVFASAFYAGFKAFAYKSLAITSAKLNKAMSSPSDLLRFEIHSGDQAREREKKQQQQQQQQQQNEQQTQQQEQKQKQPKQQRPVDDPVLSSHGIFSWKAHQSRAQSMTYTQALDAARQVFKAVWVSKQSRAMQTQTPGLLMIKGVIILQGNKGRIRLDVTAFYSPSTKTLVGLPVITSQLVIPNTQRWADSSSNNNAAAAAAVRKQKVVAVSDSTAKESQSPSPSPSQSAPPQDKDAGK